MKLIFLTTEYPTKDNKLGGIFVKDQVEALSYDNNVTVFYNYFFPLKKINLTNIFKFIFKKFFSKERGVFYYYTFLLSPFFDKLKLLADLYFSKKNLKNYIKKNGKPDCLICHFSYPVANTAMILSKEFKIPYIVVEHSTGYFRNLFSDKKIIIIKNALNKANKVVAVSNFLKKKLISIGVKTKIKVIGNVVDDKTFFPIKKKQNNRLKLLIVCELVRKKNVHQLLYVLERIFKKTKKFHLNIIGDGPERKKLEKFVIKRNLKNNINFLGILNKSKIAHFMQKSDFLLSVSKIETFGITIAEAISCGLPCILINSGGPKDFIDSSNSHLVNNFKNLEKIITKSIYKKKIFEKKKMHLHIKSKFNVRNIRKLYNKELNNVYENFNY